MKIGVDARIYKTGIGRYTKNLLKELAKIDEGNEYVVFLRKDDFGRYQPSNKRFIKVLADHPPYSFSEQIKFCWQLWRQKLDLVHFTNFNLPVMYPGKFIVTIHDLIHQSHSTYGSSTQSRPYYLVKKAVYLFVIRWVAWRAKRVLVPSKSTKDDVVYYLGVNPKKLVVTYEGLDPVLSHETESIKHLVLDKHLGITEPYLLYVGTMYPHKNHRRLIEAFQVLLRENPNLKLVLVGKVDYFSEKMKRYIDENDLSEVVIFPNFSYEDGYIPDQDLQDLYKHAEAYVFPSLKEGFGIPILEAQAYGVPVVVSDIPSLREVGEDSVEYFDPEETDSVVNQTRRVLEDVKLRKKLVKKGYDNVKRFSWSKMAKETLDVYQSI